MQVLSQGRIIRRRYALGYSSSDAAVQVFTSFPQGPDRSLVGAGRCLGKSIGGSRGGRSDYLHVLTTLPTECRGLLFSDAQMAVLLCPGLYGC